MTDQLTPCADRTNDPNDWFIRADGRQYSDDQYLTAIERSNVARAVLSMADETPLEHEARVVAATNAAIANRKRAALGRRRRAKEACFGCPIRSECLGRALDNNEIHGTWGGHYEEEIAEIRKEQARRRRRRVVGM